MDFMTDFEVDTVIIGAGVIGLAIANELSSQKKEVLIIESEDDFGKNTSSRNSGVIHAGIYYKENSLKSRLCILGNKLLYEFCKVNHVPYLNTKKLLVASSHKQVSIIDNIKSQAEKNGVEGIKKISKKESLKLEPLISCEEALLVPSSGVIDTVSFMRSLVGMIQDKGNMLAFRSEVKKINFDGKKFKISINDANETSIECNNLINSAGLHASEVSKKIEELDKNLIPKIFFSKGNYFSINKDLGIRHLIYPIPEKIGLGIHLTLELDFTIKFGPDAEWVERSDDYEVNISRKKFFIDEIKKYFPSFDGNLLQPSYSGIRPIIEKKDQTSRDFIIQTNKNHSIPNLINLYGIESPGFTSSLAIAKEIRKILEHR